MLASSSFLNVALGRKRKLRLVLFVELMMTVMPSLGFVWAFVGASVIAALLTNGDGEIKKFGTCKISWGPSVTR